MKKFDSILITGGAGYIGSVLTGKLIDRGYNVKVLDSLVFGLDGISKYVKDKKVQLVDHDIRDINALEHTIRDIDCVIHLAAIVGEPLCNKIPEAARQINEYATQNLLKLSKKSVKRFVFGSTCSNYGSSSDLVNEETPVNSLSLYSETKVNSESRILAEKANEFEPCVLRFATAFGLSPRMRFDLLLQEFIRDAIVNGKISVFGPQYWRPLVHVQDISDACINSIEADSELVSGQIYNVGDNSQNYTKIALAEAVKEHLPETEIEVQQLRKDPRNYKVSFDKIQSKLNYHITKTVNDGIIEILDEIKAGRLDPKESEFSNMSRLTENVKVFKV